MATSEGLLREWIEWCDAGKPRYLAPSRSTRKHLEQLERGPEPSAGDDERAEVRRGWMG